MEGFVLCLAVNGALTFVHFVHDEVDYGFGGDKILTQPKSLSNDEFIESLMARD